MDDHDLTSLFCLTNDEAEEVVDLLDWYFDSDFFSHEHETMKARLRSVRNKIFEAKKEKY